MTTEYDYQWIGSDAALQGVLPQLKSSTALAIDTEFVRTNTYNAKLGLLQIATRQQVFLIDPLAIKADNLAHLGDLITDNDREIVMHSAGEDLEIFLRIWQRLPPNLFDTQIAASFIGFDRQVGLQRLLKESLNVEISKDVTRSNWLQRPLTLQQQSYAAADVLFLLPLADWLREKLETMQRFSWFQQECEALRNRYLNKTPDSELYLGFGGAWKFGATKQAILKHMVQWREQTARDLDIPKTFIVKDAALCQLIDRDVKQTKDLLAVGLTHSQIRKFGTAILKQLEQAKQGPVPDTLIPRPLTKPQQKDYKVLRQWLLEQAQALDLPADLLASKSQLSEYLVAREAGNLATHSPFRGGWREIALQRFLDAKVIEETNLHDGSRSDDN